MPSFFAFSASDTLNSLAGLVAATAKCDQFAPNVGQKTSRVPSNLVLHFKGYPYFQGDIIWQAYGGVWRSRRISYDLLYCRVGLQQSIALEKDYCHFILILARPCVHAALGKVEIKYCLWVTRYCVPSALTNCECLLGLADKGHRNLHSRARPEHVSDPVMVVISRKSLQNR